MKNIKEITREYINSLDAEIARLIRIRNTVKVTVSFSLNDEPQSVEIKSSNYLSQNNKIKKIKELIELSEHKGLTINDISRNTGISIHSLYKLFRRGDIPFIKIDEQARGEGIWGIKE